jgi:hypothetical protein
MRILDNDTDKPIRNVLIMLTSSEWKYLADTIKQLTADKGDHIHVSDDIFSREVTIAIYTPDNLKFFHPRVRELIEKEV